MRRQLFVFVALLATWVAILVPAPPAEAQSATTQWLNLYKGFSRVELGHKWLIDDFREIQRLLRTSDRYTYEYVSGHIDIVSADIDRALDQIRSGGDFISEAQRYSFSFPSQRQLGYCADKVSAYHSRVFLLSTGMLLLLLSVYEVWGNGGVPKQLTDTWEGEPLLSYRQAADDAKPDARRCANYSP